MLIVCDIDGTLTDTNLVDTDCFVASLKAVAGIDPGTTDWNQFPEVTDAAIVHELLKDRPTSEQAEMEAAIRMDFMTRLAMEADANPHRFQALPGAAGFVSAVREATGFDVAIATGGWADSAQIKLQMAEIDASGLALATSSDRSQRTEIIQLAIQRSGRTDLAVVYVGDGLWDLKAARSLGLPFIGIGPDGDRLLAGGANAVYPDFSDYSAILNCIETLGTL